MSLGRLIAKGSKRPVFHITTPIFYPNAKPHLGHLYSSLLCDTTRRWYELLGYDTLFTTGTDEHGLKIQLASEKNKFSSPKDFVDVLYREFTKLDQQANIKYSRFIRTTDPDHIENVKKLWTLCWEKNFIYKGTHNGWYSVSDETFYPDSKIVQVTKDGHEISINNPNIDKLGKFINTETRNEVIFQSETNYFFKLSHFRDQLVKLIEQDDPNFIFPPSRARQILRELKGSPLTDLSVSRPSSRIKWGIDVPQDPTQKIYVWFDALCNYITSIGGIDAILSDSTAMVRHGSVTSIHQPAQWWQNTTHVIGKDIIKFHTIYWPSFLLAAGLPLPKQVVVHSHWLSGGVKMSKSLGNVVDPEEMIQYYGSDTMRWFLLENSQLDIDGDFNEKRLHATREQLVSKWGNLINRCCAKKFDLHRAVDTFAGKTTYAEIATELLNEQQRDLFAKLMEQSNDLVEVFHEKFTKFHTNGALKVAWSLLNDTNQFVQISEPWSKSESTQDFVIFTAIEVSRILSILCQPVIPELSNSFLNRIDISLNRRTIEYAKFGFDHEYGGDANKKGRDVPLKRIPYRISV